MADYSKMKNAELETLLKERGLPHTGKKAELVKRLQDSDTTGNAPASTSTKTAEDEIDWDDETATTDAAKATTEPAATAIAAGGQGPVDNPQAVPNQVADIDPAKTDDLTVAKPTDTTSSTQPETAAPEQKEKEKTPVDFSSGLAATTLEEEIEKRKARAKKFGIDLSADETLKALERQKKFGGSELPSKLNEALPERRERKRGREGGEDAGDRKRGRPGPGGRRGSNRRGPAPRENGTKPAASVAKPATSGYSAEDRAKADARKAKFATPA